MTTLKKKFNRIRKKTMQKLTNSLTGFDPYRAKMIPVPSVKNVLIVRPNHRLGNQILTSPIIQEIENTFPNASIDLFSGKVSPILFSNYKSLNQCIRVPRKPLKEFRAFVKAWLQLRAKKYDFVLNVDQGSSSGRLATKFSKGKIKLYGEITEHIRNNFPDHVHIAKIPIYYLREMMEKMGYTPNTSPLPYLSIKLSAEEIAKGKDILNNLIPNASKQTIALYTYATGTKCYSKEWWKAFYETLKENYPSFNIIEILPVENISMIDFQAPALYSKDIREMGAVMANTVAYIGADCGIMHLASASGVSTIGLFSVTDPGIYEPYNPGSIALTTNNQDFKEILDAFDQIKMLKNN